MLIASLVHKIFSLLFVGEPGPPGTPGSDGKFKYILGAILEICKGWA